MAEIWVWLADCCARESAALLTMARELMLPDEELWAVAVQKQEAPPLPEISGLRRCAADGSAGYKGRVLAKMAERYKPRMILFPTGAESSCAAATAAALLDTGLSADCTALRRQNELLIMHRPAFGGGVVADIVCPEREPQMATVRPGAMPTGPFTAVRAREQLFTLDEAVADRIELLSIVREKAERRITGAGVIVAGGMGVGSREGFELLDTLAGKLGGMLGASRAAVDAGYAPWQRQVGQTGSTVHPRLYLAFGISGSIQHVAGMHTAGYIAAVNTDRRAPIFDYSDLAVVADWKTTAEYLLERF